MAEPTGLLPRFDPQAPGAYAKARPRDGDGPYVRYQYLNRDLPLAINAALVTARPLLLRGEPGSGKSSLAYDIAMVLGWQYYERVISSRMSASDLLWTFDAVRRLSDASKKRVGTDLTRYIQARELWHVLDPRSASEFGGPIVPGDDPAQGAVLLLDEIDKADPDLPNDLLVVLGERRFTVTELRRVFGAQRKDLLFVITTNGERELPPPFLRRCVCVQLETPDAAALKQIAMAHIPKLAEDSRVDPLIRRMLAIREACRSDQHRPGTAEILDAIRAVHELGIQADDPAWGSLIRAMGWKNPEPPPSI